MGMEMPGGLLYLPENDIKIGREKKRGARGVHLKNIIGARPITRERNCRREMQKALALGPSQYTQPAASLRAFQSRFFPFSLAARLRVSESERELQ